MAAKKCFCTRERVGLCVGWMLVVSVAYAQERPIDITRDISPWLDRIEATRAMSTSQRFLVSGMSRDRNVQLAAWADDVLAKAEGFVGHELAWEHAQRFHIAARTNASTADRAILRMQGWVDGRIKQRLVIHEPEKADQEEILEGLCWLLLNDYAALRIEPAERTASLVKAPDWLAVGLAQNLYPLSRERNSRLVLAHWDTLPSVQQILSFDVLPEGRWLEKAACGLFVDWLRAMPQSIGVFDELFDRMAAGHRADSGWFAKTIGQGASARDLEKEWDLWIAGQKLIRWQLGELTPDRLQKLKEYSTIHTRDAGFLVTETLPAVLTMDDLVTYGEADSVKRLAEWSSLRVKSLGIGEPDAFRQVVTAYGDFLDAVGRGEPRQSAKLAKAKRLLEVLEADQRKAPRHETRYPAWAAMSRSISEQAPE